MPNIADKLTQVNSCIQAAALKHSRNADDITLLAVSKKHPASSIAEAYEFGQKKFGENYVQEALEKMSLLEDLIIEWHFIGPIQSNKTRAIAENFSWVHSIDRLKIAQRIAEQRPDNLPPLNICVQINIDEEESKSGILANEAEDFLHEIHTFSSLNVRGLMAIPKPLENTPNEKAFKAMNALYTRIKSKKIFPNFDTLSMGMSGDLDTAIHYGSTLVRIGTDIFGARNN